MKVKIGIADDHQLFLKSLCLMLASFNEYEVVLEALNGKDLQEKIAHKTVLPEIMLIDVNMPVMDGIATATWLTEHYPAIKLAALSMNDSDTAVISMLKAGCCAYLLKDTHPTELEKALKCISEKGYYNADAINYRKIMNGKEVQITVKEKEFLQLACSDMTYKFIAAKMNLSERTIDGYRESLFEKLKVQSRVGMALEAIRRNLVSL